MTTSTATTAGTSTRTWTVPRLTESVPAARHTAHSVLTAWDYCPETVEVALLIVSELVTNAVQHADGQHIICTASRRDDVLTLSVSNTSNHAPRIPRPRSPEPVEEINELGESGRGLGIIEVLADEWGTRLTTDGCEVWAHLSA